MQEVVKAGKRILKPAGYFILMIEFEMFGDWYKALSSNGFNVKSKPMLFVYDPDIIPTRHSVDFPSSMEEYCIVSRLPGVHPSGFNPNFGTHFHHIQCNWTRRTSIVTNVKLPKNRLCHTGTRKPVRISEKPIDLLVEIIDLFVPPYGSAIDIYGGTFTLPIAALKPSRKCVAIENDKICYDLAVRRLKILCDPIFKFVINPYGKGKVNHVNGGYVEAVSHTNQLSNGDVIETPLTSSNDSANDTNQVVSLHESNASSEKISIKDSSRFIVPNYLEETSRDANVNENHETHSKRTDESPTLQKSSKSRHNSIVSNPSTVSSIARSSETTLEMTACTLLELNKKI